MNESTLLQEIRAGIFREVYLLYGEEKYFTQKYVKWIIENALSGDSSNHIALQGNPEISEFSDHVTALPMFSIRKVISVSDIDIEKEDSSYADTLMNILLTPHPECIILMYITSFSIAKRKEKTKRLLSAVNEAGGAIEFKTPAPEKAAPLLIRCARAREIGLSQNNAMTIAEYTLCNMSVAISEVEKLCSLTLDKDEQEISLSDIELIIPKQHDVKIYELADAVINYNRTCAPEILQELLNGGFHPIMLIGSLNTVFVRIYRAKTAIHNHVQLGTFIEQYSDEKQRNVERAFSFASNVNTPRMRNCLYILQNADEQLKTTSIDAEYVVQHTIILLMER